MEDVIIIGAGIVGACAARKLAQYNLKTLVLEKELDVSTGSTKANSAIVHGGYAESHEKLKGRLCYKGRQQFDRLNRELNFGYKTIGSMVLSWNSKDRAALEAIKANGEKNGLRDLRILNREEILKREPSVDPSVELALFCEGAGICSPYEMAIAMMENALDNKVNLLLSHEVVGIERTERGARVRCSNNKVFESRLVINAAGLGAQTIAEMMGDTSFTIRPRAGEYLIFARGTGKLVHHVLFQMPTKLGKGILVTPTIYGNLLLGPDALDDEDSLNTHLKRLELIFNAGRMTAPKIDPSTFLRSFTGVRAISSTDDFVIRRVKETPFILACGIQSPGLTSSPAIADLILEYVEEILGPLTRNQDFNPTRRPIVEEREWLSFPALKERVAMEEGDERIVCRCEQVSEKSIREALHRKIPVVTLDGVKRRTRAGMGWCQGGFCRQRVRSLMEKELGQSILDRVDVERKGITRVDKNEFLEFLAQKSKKENESHLD